LANLSHGSRSSTILRKSRRAISFLIEAANDPAVKTESPHQGKRIKSAAASTSDGSDGSNGTSGPGFAAFAGNAFTHQGGPLSMSDGTFGSLSPPTPPIQNGLGGSDVHATQDIKVESDMESVAPISGPQQEESWAPFIPDLDLPDVYSAPDKAPTLSIPTFDWDPMTLFREDEGRSAGGGEFPWYLSGSVWPS
jgi:hypothetical protein